MKWEIPELVGELRLDGERKVLFVEGNADLALWRSLLPEGERGNVVVYPIAVVAVAADGGERGRLIELARVVSTLGLAHRVHFFADADFDRLLGREVPDSVSLTDGRDRESYLLLCDGIEEVCCGEACPIEAARKTKNFLTESGLPIAVLRVASERLELKLPFQKTLEKGIGRFMDRKAERLMPKRFKEAVFQNGPGLGAMRDFHMEMEEIVRGLEAEPVHELLHGRDLLLLLAWKHEWRLPETERIVSMALRAKAREIANMPSVAGVIRWAKAA